MNSTEVQKRIEKLKKLINHHRYLYHVLDKQEISESALDSLKKELFDLEQKYPQFITADSPTQRIGGKPLEKFEKVKHPAPMLSFNDAFSKEDMEDWLERNSKLLPDADRAEIDYYCEPKLDGLAIELIYKEGIFELGSTRGDGLIGEDVTQNLKTIESIPLRLREIEEVEKDLEKEGWRIISENIKKKKPKEIVVRGEATITKKDFESVNREQTRVGQLPFANPRNLAAGSIRQLDPKITAKRRLEITTYDLISDFGQKSHCQEHKILEILGFKTNNKYSKYCKNLAEVLEFHDFWYRNRGRLPYEIDGIVVTINKNEIFERLGVVGKAPRGAIAFKFPLKQATTTIEDIKLQVGRTGAITPVAILKPVQVGGVTISRATLHNEDEIKRLDVRIGDTAVVGRAGDVIPDIMKVLVELRTGKEKEFKIPKNCPVCQTELIRPQREALWRCPNPDCFAKQRRYFYHFVSRGAFDITGLGPKIIDKLIEEGLVSDPADLFNLKEGDLLPLERFAEKSAQNLVESIQSRKKISFPKFIYALGIRNIGQETAQDLAEYFGSLVKLKNASFEDFQKIRDIGPVVAKSIFDFLREKRNLKFIEKLVKSGVEIEKEKKSLHQPLKGKTFVLTGALETISREGAKEKIRELGGDVNESVSKKIDYVVFGKEPGSKLEKARRLNLKIIREKEFRALIKK